jgi:hypothetical protein
LANIKAVPSSLNFKWLPLSKLQQRRVVTTNEQESTASDLLLASLQVSISSSVASEFESKNELIFIFLAEPDRNAQIGSIKLAILRIDKPVGLETVFSRVA